MIFFITISVNFSEQKELKTDKILTVTYCYLQLLLTAVTYQILIVMLWVDAHRPTTLDDLTFNGKLSDKLKNACKSDLSHMIFSGPRGSGKRTRIYACLKEVYGINQKKVKIQHRQYKLPSKKFIEITTLASNHHVEIDISENKQGNRIIIPEIVNEITGANNSCYTDIPLKVIVLMHAEELNVAAQHALRKVMEQYSSTCRFILSTNSLSKIIEPLESRCLIIRVAAPTNNDMFTVLQDIREKEGQSTSEATLNQIVQVSDRNLEKAILCYQRTAFGEDENKVDLPDWEEYISAVVKCILNVQNSGSIIDSRTHVYELMGKCIDPTEIFKKLVKQLCMHIDVSIKPEIFKWAAHYDHAMQLGGKPIMHIEAFIVKSMEIYHNFLSKMICGSDAAENEV